MIINNITQGLNIPAIKKEQQPISKKIQENNSTTNEKQNVELSIQHDTSTHLSEVQQALKEKRVQNELDEIEKAKRANKTITTTMEGENGIYTVETKYDALGNEEKRIVKREDGSICNIDEFNNGIISKTQMFFPGGTIAGDIEYNNDGKPIKEKNYSSNPNENGVVVSSVDYEYYENGNLKCKKASAEGGIDKEEAYYENGSLKYTKNGPLYEEYNEQGQQTLYIVNNSDNLIENKFEYNSSGQLIKEINHTYIDGEERNTITDITYENNIKKSIHKYSNGEVYRISTEETLPDGSSKGCTYSPDGILREETIIHINSDDEEVVNTHCYNEKGKLVAYQVEDAGIFKYYNAEGQSITVDDYEKIVEEQKAGAAFVQ